jgi:hypothetical protein
MTLQGRAVQAYAIRRQAEAWVSGFPRHRSRSVSPPVGRDDYARGMSSTRARVAPVDDRTRP